MPLSYNDHMFHKKHKKNLILNWNPSSKLNIIRIFALDVVSPSHSCFRVVGIYTILVQPSCFYRYIDVATPREPRPTMEPGHIRTKKNYLSSSADRFKVYPRSLIKQHNLLIKMFEVVMFG